MNYELSEKIAKELMEADFPFKKPSLEDGEIRLYPPTLAELIEACGAGFRELRLVFGVWEATAENGKIFPDFGHEIGRGSTPEEAVARLWISLNKKP